MRRIVRWLAPVLLAGTVWTGFASAQDSTTTPDTVPERNTVLPMAIGAGCTILVLLIICMPSRKAT